jgi:large subunit ribosomal protein L16
MFEIGGVSEELARRAFELGAAKLPVKSKFVKRLNSDIVEGEA